MNVTNKGHLSNLNNIEEDYQNNKYIYTKNNDLIEQNDGNNVNLDTQMSEMSKNNVIFDAIQASIKKDSELFRSVISSSEKN